MSRNTERDEFIALLARELPDIATHLVIDLAHKLLRASATLTRLAEAQCNGDYPADNGERDVVECSRCGLYWTRESMKNISKSYKKADRVLLCKDCTTEDRVKALVKPYGFEVLTQGDPRGCVLKLRVLSGRTNDAAREGICVP